MTLFLFAVTLLLCLWCARLVYGEYRADRRRKRHMIRRAAKRAKKRREALSN